MSRSNVILLLLLTVSQRALLRTAENRTNTESWYAAVMEEDASFSPKSISELFTTEKSFSTTNSIVLSQSSTSVPPVEIISQFPVSETSGTPMPYSIQPSQSPSPYPTQSIEMQSVQPTTPVQVRFVETTMRTQSIQPSIPYNSQPQTHFNKIEVAPQNLQAYQLVPIVMSAPVHSAQVHQARPSSPLPPIPEKPKTTLKPATRSEPPCTDKTKPYPQIRIRMSSPRGVTNITVHPVSTTKRRTTKNPSESKKRSNREDYDECLKVCGDGRKRVCATPAGAKPINPDNLRGFPSVCHLACHNSFRNNKYEKLLDGRCSRFRTRIRPVDSNNKIKKIELNKLQYQVVNEPQTIIEFEPIQ